MPAFTGRLYSVKRFSHWNTTRSRQRPTVVEIAYGSAGRFPQYAALHTDSSYLRLTGGSATTWGTSVVLLPVVWQARRAGPTQGAPITITSCQEEDAGTFVLAFNGCIAGLRVTGSLRFFPPIVTRFQVDAAVAVSGATALNVAHASESFKTVMLSSMRVRPDVWDTDRAFAGAKTRDIPAPGHWIFSPSLECHTFGLRGGGSRWQRDRPAPSVAITSSESLAVAGWVSAPGRGRTGGPNSDNVALWAAHDHVQTSWRYTITAQTIP